MGSDQRFNINTLGRGGGHSGEVVKAVKSTLVEYPSKKKKSQSRWAGSTVCLLCSLAWCVWFCLLFVVVCSTLMGTRHTTALHAVNRPHAENVDETKISSDGSAIKAEGLSFVIVMSCFWWQFIDTEDSVVNGIGSCLYFVEKKKKKTLKSDHRFHINWGEQNLHLRARAPNSAQ